MTVDEFAIARTYDADGKVSHAVVPAGSARGIVGTHAYQYDVLNRRVRKTVGGATPSDTVFIHTGEQITADYAAGTAAASPTTKYLWGSYIDELVCSTAGSQKLYPHRNQQYSTTALTDQTGTVVERYAYTSYGDLIVLDPTTPTVRTTAPMSRFTYTGREHDYEVGAYHFRARPYLPTLGRFPSHDPIMYPDGYNTYTGWFAGKGTDPTGMFLGYGYGNYCGYSRAARCPPGSGVKPIDAVDAACERHDCCLARWYDCWKVTSCDSKLCSEVYDAYDFGCVQSYPGDKKKQDACKDAASKIGAVFCWFTAPGVNMYPDGNPIPMM